MRPAQVYNGDSYTRKMASCIKLEAPEPWVINQSILVILDPEHLVNRIAS